MVAPYYEQDGITIFHGDCRDVLPVLAPVDVVLADPPYGVTSLAWDRWVPGWTDLLPPVLAPSGSLWCFGSLRMFLDHAADFTGWQFAQDVVWEKHNGSSFHADRFKRVHEQIAQFYPAGRRWDAVYKAPITTPDATPRVVRRKQRPPHTGHIEASRYVSVDGGPRLMRSVWAVRSCHGYAMHPTQKPLGVLLPLIEYSCPVNGMIIDPFMGSGSALRAAADCGRHAIGIEVEERYCEIAANRLRQMVLL